MDPFGGDLDQDPYPNVKKPGNKYLKTRADCGLASLLDRCSDPGLSQKTGSGFCTSNEGIFSQFYFNPSCLILLVSEVPLMS